MVRGGNGYVTVNVGSTGRPRPLPPGLRQDTDTRNRRAIRLRTEGWSYRHISVALDMSYASVCELLDGEEARLPVTPLPLSLSPVPEVKPQPTSLRHIPASDNRLDQLAAQISRLQSRVDLVVAMQESIRKRLSRLEDKILNAMKQDHQRLSQHLQNTMKTMLTRVLPQPERKGEREHK